MTRKLRLLCIGRDLSPAGAERVQAALFRHLDRSRFSVDLHYMSDGDDLLDEMPAGLVPRFGRVGRVPCKLAGARTLHRLVRAARRSDLIFATQEGSPVYLAAIAGAVARKPVVGWIHGPWSRLRKQAGGWHALAARILYPRASRLVCVSEGVRRDLESESPSLADRLAVLPNPLDIERIRTQSLEPAPPWAANFPDEGAIVACGRLVPDKGFDLLLRAVAKSASCRRGTRLVVLGEGPERARLESLVIELGLRGRVSLPGHLANPYPVFRRAAVFVLSSRVEGVGMVLLEAMTLSVPVVAFDSDAGGPREIFGAQDCGQLVEAGDPGRLADAIDRMLGDRALAARCRDWGERRARKFDAERAARRFETLFQSVLDAARSRRS